MCVGNRGWVKRPAEETGVSEGAIKKSDPIVRVVYRELFAGR
jgi:hypothetical protein